MPEQAAEFDKTVNAHFSGMKFFPLLLKRLAKDPTQYKTAMEGGVELCRKNPELVTAANWVCLQEKSNLGRPNPKLPSASSWFTPDLSYGTAFDFDSRYYDLQNLCHAGSAVWEELKAMAPWDFDVIRGHRTQKYGKSPTGQQAAESCEKIGDYNLKAMLATAHWYKDDPVAYQKHIRKACELDPDTYVTLGEYLVEHNLPEAAASAYQMAFDKAQDRLLVANSCGWIVNYYFDHGRKQDALKIATEAADVYSHEGLETMAQLMERMDRLTEAEQYYSKLADRYDDSGPLCRFYSLHKDKNPRYGVTLKNLSSKMFPGGIKHVKLSDFTSPPIDGVSIDSTNANTDRAGIKQGDVIVAIDGYHVHSMEQYTWVRGLTNDPNLSLIVWNGGQFSEVNISLPDRRFGNDISTYRAR